MTMIKLTLIGGPCDGQIRELPYKRLPTTYKVYKKEPSVSMTDNAIPWSNQPIKTLDYAVHTLTDEHGEYFIGVAPSLKNESIIAILLSAYSTNHLPPIKRFIWTEPTK